MTGGCQQVPAPDIPLAVVPSPPQAIFQGGHHIPC